MDNELQRLETEGSVAPPALVGGSSFHKNAFHSQTASHTGFYTRNFRSMIRQSQSHYRASILGHFSSHLPAHSR